MEFNKETGVAIARLIVTIAVAIATTFGWSLDGDLLFNILLSAIALALFAWTWWKNNNVTAAAQQAQGVLDAIKRDEREVR